MKLKSRLAAVAIAPMAVDGALLRTDGRDHRADRARLLELRVAADGATSEPLQLKNRKERNMKRIVTIAIPLALALAASAPGPSALAQGMPEKMDAGRMTGPGYEVTAEMQRYREMAGLMRDMSRQMNRMQEAMAKGEMSPERRTRMRQQLKEMSDMMTRMAGLADRPSMNDPETRKQTGEMREQMDKLMREQP